MFAFLDPNVLISICHMASSASIPRKTMSWPVCGPPLRDAVLMCVCVCVVWAGTRYYSDETEISRWIDSSRIESRKMTDERRNK